jgi:hypothetical protein
MSKVYKMLSDLESTYGIAFGGSDDSDSSSESDSSSSSVSSYTQSTPASKPESSYPASSSAMAQQATHEFQFPEPSKECVVAAGAATAATLGVIALSVAPEIVVSKPMAASTALGAGASVANAYDECSK